MATSSFFSVPAAVILNKRLISSRGGLELRSPETPETLRFKLFLNSKPSSVRYGVTIQISALRDMSKEHNIDQIPEHPAYIYFPSNSIFHLYGMKPNKNGIQSKEMEAFGLDEYQAQDMTNTFRKFWVREDADLEGVRHLIVKCHGAVIDSIIIPKLRSEALEWELKRIFGTVKTANELDDACLELDCLLPALEGDTDRAVQLMHDATAETLRGVRETDEVEGKKQGSSDGEGQAVGIRKVSKPKVSKPKFRSKEKFVWKERAEISQVESLRKEKTVLGGTQDDAVKKLFIPAIIDGKFASSDKTAPFPKNNGSLKDVSLDTTPKTSPVRYLHPNSLRSRSAEGESGLEKDSSTPKIIG